jgi:hypothetical protein
MRLIDKKGAIWVTFANNGDCVVVVYVQNEGYAVHCIPRQGDGARKPARLMSSQYRSNPQ